MNNLNSIRAAYERHGVKQYYAQFGASYRNPHEAAVRGALRHAAQRWLRDMSQNILDPACGSGEVTLALRELDAERIEGIDPYTGAAYQERTGQAAQPYSFEDIAAGALAGRRYGLIVCSFALHLVAESRLPMLAYQLSALSGALLILTPHKRPALKREWGWQLGDEFAQDRVRARLYQPVYYG
jgi:2-polyprenyl-3-methyl-5-hydroxy-6-metoxy-1,4-benzoquinol methylase